MSPLWRRYRVLTSFRFLYIFFLAIDACFRLKRRLISSVLKDPSLGSGWSYMVETLMYRTHLLTVTDQKEVRQRFIYHFEERFLKTP